VDVPFSLIVADDLFVSGVMDVIFIAVLLLGSILFSFAVPDEIYRQRLGEIRSGYLDAGERLLEAKKRLQDAASNALETLDSEIGAS
jgi:hypothetical protein